MYGRNYQVQFCCVLISIRAICVVIVVKSDVSARNTVHSNVPNIVLIAQVEHVIGKDLTSVVGQQWFVCLSDILVGGDGPCRGNLFQIKFSWGLGDPRPRQPLALKRITREIEVLSIVASNNTKVLAWLNHVSSSPVEVLTVYSDWFGTTPICLKVRQFGYATRSRSFRGRTQHRNFTNAVLKTPCWRDHCSMNSTDNVRPTR